MTITPAMQQYYDLKEISKDAILFFRMGDFYEMFDEDAHIAHKVLGINITSRNKNAETPTPLAGIPYHAKNKYLPRLVKAGYKVAVAEQVSDPKLKGIVKREIVRIVTPATLSLEEDDYETSDISNYILSICEENGKYGVSFLESSNPKWKTGEFSDINKLASEVYKISPKEVILEKSLFDNQEINDLFSKKYSLNIYYYEFNGKAKVKLLKHFGVKNLEGYGIENKELAQKSSAQLLSYLEENQKSDLSYLDSIGFESFSDCLELDEATIRNLDLIYNIATKSQNIGTLFGILDETKTSMGKRLLRENILRPLQSKKEIENRLNIIEELLANPILLDKITNKLKLVSDVDNILTRLALNRALPRDLINLKNSLKAILEIFELIKENGNKKLVKLLKLK